MNRILISSLALLAAVAPAFSQTTQLVGIGDSLGEGVQSFNAFAASSPVIGSQPNGYLNQVAQHWGIHFSLPLISSGILGIVGSASGRSRVSPTVEALDLAVSGATTNDVLTTVGNATIQTETDLVLSPITGQSQIQIAQSKNPQVIFCWVGNDDLIGYILDYNRLTHPTVTSFSDFKTQYTTLMADLKATGAKVVLANIPDLTKVGYLFDNATLQKYLGTTTTLLPPGYYTTFATFLEIKLGVLKATVLTDPNYVLSPTNLTNIQKEVKLFNAEIAKQAAANGFALVDAFTIVNNFTTTPITIGGVTIGGGYNQGAFSLDGIHPSDTGYALFADAFVTEANATYNLGIPPFSDPELKAVVYADPFVDFDGSGIVHGRPNTGFLETVGPHLGVSGNKNNVHPAGTTQLTRAASPAYVPANKPAFMRAYFEAIGKDPGSAYTDADVITAVEHMLTVDQLRARNHQN